MEEPCARPAAGLSVVSAAERMGGRPIVVDAVDEAAVTFSLRYDFSPVVHSEAGAYPRRLVLKVATARVALGLQPHGREACNAASASAGVMWRPRACSERPSTSDDSATTASAGSTSTTPAAATRDASPSRIAAVSARFDDGARFCPGRREQHLGFGHGPHYCLSASLARAELIATLPVLARRLPELRLAVPVAEIPWQRGFVDHGPLALPVT